MTIEHHHVAVPGGSIYVAEQGDGPAVLLLHGFPDGWHTWRHQMAALAGAGRRALAIDLRGYGDSLTPPAVEDYRMLTHVADAVAVLDALGVGSAAILGHDWGSPIAAACALLRPDRFGALALLGVPYAPRAPMPPTEAFALAGGDEEFYVAYFQQPGRAEAEIEPDVRRWLVAFYAALTGPGAARHAAAFTIPPGGRMLDRLPADAVSPPWLDAADLDASVRAFERRGIAGALNRYRNVDRDWADLAAWDGVAITQPAVYIAGEHDPSTTWLADAIAAHPDTLPGLSANHLLPGCGHWVHRERPEEVNRILLDWV